jgi:hypothetical protein
LRRLEEFFGLDRGTRLGHLKPLHNDAIALLEAIAH